MKEVTEKTLSYSSMSLLQNCEKRYAHYKVYDTPIDSDAQDSTEAFNLGKAFHAVLESTNHEPVDNLTPLVEEKVKEHEVVAAETPKVEAMCRKYYRLNELSGLKCIACEIEVRTNNFLGYVDAIMEDVMGNWWIVDLKTAARVSPMLLSRLKHDTQLNLYGSHFELIAEKLNIPAKRFKGMRYRVTTKSKLIMKTTEGYNGFVKRVMNGIESYDIAIPKNEKIMTEARKRHNQLHERSLQLFAGEEPKCNYTYCDSYFRPCPYWSQCHGDTYTNCEKGLKMLTAKDYEEKIGDL